MERDARALPVSTRALASPEEVTLPSTEEEEEEEVELVADEDEDAVAVALRRGSSLCNAAHSAIAGGKREPGVGFRKVEEAERPAERPLRKCVTRSAAARGLKVGDASVSAASALLEPKAEAATA